MTASVFSAASDGEPSALLPQPSHLFLHRRDRLRQLAGDSPVADWLLFVAALADVQHQLHAAHGEALKSAAAQVLREDGARLDLADLPAHPLFDVLAKRYLESCESALDGAPQQAARKVLTATPEQRRALAERVLAANLQEDDLASSPFIVAVLEVFAAAVASQARPQLESSVSGSCPVCDAAPVAGVIEEGGEEDGRRYLHCGRCSTVWHHVRATCTHCGEARQVAYQSLDSGDTKLRSILWQGETCDSCHGYLKLLSRRAAPKLDAVADDLASLELDLALGEVGYQRAGRNPYLLLADDGA